MHRDHLLNLHTFAVVAQEKNFSKAAVLLGSTQSAISHAMNRLEDRIGVRLLNRTTRSVSVTQAGTQLLKTLRPSLESIETVLAELESFRDIPSGLIRIASPEHATRQILVPALAQMLSSYPEISIEIDVTLQVKDIVEEQYDAGVCIGELLHKDMVALPIGPKMRMAVVGSPEYFARNESPVMPQDLKNHPCIGYRRPGTGTIYEWEFESESQTYRHKPDRALTVNELDTLIDFALSGAGLICVPDFHILDKLENNVLIQVLHNWSAPFEGYSLYYSTRRAPTQAFRILMDSLRL
ncbi:LysR substrate-binding domain-containing protein [Yersinia aleksiciae]|jgi:DNA-binding transcriptional LysR family regulator|uniref:LysR substrate-binding domain-containing protein n=1 Tax=Yersinia aleksiciae TaxID=263819 RepID=UPI0005E0D33A|nr:LysR substrate-binding domain-containing protein [Yersinia aleksiciae]CFQ45853.1 putative LysR-family transcriptional regulatory protein [Yersinia aleksiciae]